MKTTQSIVSLPKFGPALQEDRSGISIDRCPHGPLLSRVLIVTAGTDSDVDHSFSRAFFLVFLSQAF